jgi:O-succinylbenzoate synthase
MKIWYSTYQLYPKGTLNSQVKTKFRKGALLRIRFDDEIVGFADLCPFSEMGNRPLEFEMRHIALQKPTALGVRALHFARLDAEARAKKENLYDPTVKIKNHFLVADISQFDLDRVEKIEAAGYSEFKIKMGRDLALETQLVEKLTNRFSNRARIRLDFNGSMSRDRFVDWFDKNQKWLRPVIEFIEDPFAYDPKEWAAVSDRRNITFALDQLANPLEVKAEGAGVIVIKPVTQDSEAVIKKFAGTNKKFIFTHHMDFPLGQMEAFSAAQQAFKSVGEQMLSCGLQHHDIYEGFTFQEAIRSDGPFIVPPEGFGFGFDKLLESQSWSELK